MYNVAFFLVIPRTALQFDQGKKLQYSEKHYKQTFSETISQRFP